MTTAKVSVALAAKNGADYIEAQLASILPQLQPSDELVVSIDPSTDGTQGIVAALAAAHPQIKVVQGPGRGVIANFEHAINQTSGTTVFLSDHDDIWMPTKVQDVLRALDEHDVACVLHDASIVDAELQQTAPSFFAWRGSRPGWGRNIVKNSYIGCCMAFRSELKPVVLPFPGNIPMHDQWIGLLAQKHGGVYFLPKPLIQYRRHGANATNSTPSGPLQMLTWRKNLISALKTREKELQ